MATGNIGLEEIAWLAELQRQFGELPTFQAGSILGTGFIDGNFSVVIGDAERRPLALVRLSLECGQEAMRHVHDHVAQRASAVTALRH